MDDFTPKYIHIQQYILDEIEKGNLKPGDKIPSENVLSQNFNVSRVTANRAIRELYTMGIVERVQGKGTFVIEKQTDIKHSSYMFSDDINVRLNSSHLGDKNHKLYKIEIVKVDKDICTLLNINENDMVYKIIRTVEKDNIVTFIDYSYVPVSLISHTSNFDDLEATYLHKFLKDNSDDINPSSLGVFVKSRFPDKLEMKMLRVDSSSPILVWDTRIYDESKKIIAFTTSVAKSDSYKPFINFTLD